MSMFSNQATPDEFLESAWEAYCSTGKPAFDTTDFNAICDDWNIEPWELQDIVNDMNETPDFEEQQRIDDVKREDFICGEREHLR